MSSSADGTAAVPFERRPLITTNRAVLGLLLWTAMALVVAQAARARAVEARAAAFMAAPFTPGRAGSNGDVILTGLGTAHLLALRITNECTVVLLVVPMLFLAGLLTFFPRFSKRSIFAGLLAGVAAVVITNQVRIVLIAWATHAYGVDLGYDLTHKFFGSILAVFGFVAGLLIMIRIVPHMFHESRRR
jgi:exosortase/archaeosortase family protein